MIWCILFAWGTRTKSGALSLPKTKSAPDRQCKIYYFATTIQFCEFEPSLKICENQIAYEIKLFYSIQANL